MRSFNKNNRPQKRRGSFFTAAAVLLALTLIASAALVSCSSDGNVDHRSDENRETVYDTRYEADELPDYLDFEGETVTFMVWRDAPNLEFYTSDLSGETVNDAVYNRNIAVADRLGITLEFKEVSGGKGNESEFTSTVNSIVRSNDSTYNVIAGYAAVMTQLCGSGNFLPLDDVDYLQLEKPWWPNDFCESTRLDGRIFMLTGDISTNFIYRLGVTFFNKEVAEAYAIDDLYDVVRAGGFTVDYMLALTKDMFTDINGNSTKDYWDRFGYVTADDSTDMLVFSCDIPISQQTDGGITLSDDYAGEKLLSLLQNYTSALYNSNGCAIFERDTAQAAFNRGKTLMFTDRIDTYKKIMYSDVVYGVLPLPKYNESQKDYVTAPDNNITLYAVPVSVTYSDISGAVLECMASESYRQVTPALFDVALKYRYSDSPADTEMFELIRENVTFDLLYMMKESVEYPSFSEAVAENNTDWYSAIAASETSLRRAVNKYFEKISEID